MKEHFSGQRMCADVRLEGSHVYLRPVSLADTDLILRWRSDPRIASQLFSERPPTREEHHEWFAKTRETRDRFEFVIVIRETDQPIGTIGLSHIDWQRQEAEYGILIGEARWHGKGMAQEASALLLQYAFQVLQLRTVTLRTFADNRPARALYERLGFVQEPALSGRHQQGNLIRETVTMKLCPPQVAVSRRP